MSRAKDAIGYGLPDALQIRRGGLEKSSQLTVAFTLSGVSDHPLFRLFLGGRVIFHCISWKSERPKWQRALIFSRGSESNTQSFCGCRMVPNLSKADSLVDDFSEFHRCFSNFSPVRGRFVIRWAAVTSDTIYRFVSDFR